MSRDDVVEFFTDEVPMAILLGVAYTMVAVSAPFAGLAWVYRKLSIEWRDGADHVGPE